MQSSSNAEIIPFIGAIFAIVVLCIATIRDLNKYRDTHTPRLETVRNTYGGYHLSKLRLVWSLPYWFILIGVLAVAATSFGVIVFTFYWQEVRLSLLLLVSAAGIPLGILGVSIQPIQIAVITFAERWVAEITDIQWLHLRRILENRTPLAFVIEDGSCEVIAESIVETLLTDPKWREELESGPEPRNEEDRIERANCLFFKAVVEALWSGEFSGQQLWDDLEIVRTRTNCFRQDYLFYIDAMQRDYAVSVLDALETAGHPLPRRPTALVGIRRAYEFLRKVDFNAVHLGRPPRYFALPALRHVRSMFGVIDSRLRKLTLYESGQDWKHFRRVLIKEAAEGGLWAIPRDEIVLPFSRWQTIVLLRTGCLRKSSDVENIRTADHDLPVFSSLAVKRIAELVAARFKALDAEGKFGETKELLGGRIADLSRSGTMHCVDFVLWRVGDQFDRASNRRLCVEFVSRDGERCPFAVLDICRSRDSVSKWHYFEDKREIGPKDYS